MKFNHLVLILLLGWMVIGSSCKKRPTLVVTPPKITQSKFDKQAAKMIKIVNRLFSLADVEMLKKEALSYSFGKAISCQEVAGECRAYYKLVSYMVKAAEDKRLSFKEQEQIRALERKFRQVLKASRKILFKQWDDYSKKP